MIHLGRNTWRELEKRVIRSLKVVYSKTENKGDYYSFIHSFFFSLDLLTFAGSARINWIELQQLLVLQIGWDDF